MYKYALCFNKIIELSESESQESSSKRTRVENESQPQQGNSKKIGKEVNHC